MATVTGATYSGLIKIDLSDVEDDLVDLPPGATQRLRSEQPGMDAVIDELGKVMPVLGDKAGVSPNAYQTFLQLTDRLKKLHAHEAELEKALEVVRETRAKTEHDRENTVSMIVDAVKSTADRTGEKGPLAAFEKTIEYNSQIAQKAVQTRRKNEDARKKAEEAAKAGSGSG